MTTATVTEAMHNVGLVVPASPLLSLPLLPDNEEVVLRTEYYEPLPADINYYLDCSVELGHIGPDTAFFMREIHPNPVAFIDAGTAAAHTAHFGLGGQTNGRWLDHLRAFDLHLENEYISWRRDNRERARVVSAAMSRHGMAWLLHFIEESARGLVNTGQTVLPCSTSRHMDDFNRTAAVFKRSYNRMATDLLDCLKDDLDRLIASMNTQIRCEAITRDPHPLTRVQKQRVKANASAARKMVKRSIAFLSGLIGQEPVRLFIGTNRLTISGQHCDYVLTRNGGKLAGGGVAYSHGGASCTLHRKSDGATIANLCVFTPDVPLLDHVANLIMHIRTGNEEAILENGNWFNIDEDVAATVPSFARWLPKPLEKNDEVRFAAINEDCCNPDEWEVGKQKITHAEWRRRVNSMKDQIRATLPTEWFFSGLLREDSLAVRMLQGVQ